MQKVKQVFTDNYYKREYVEYKNAIYEKEFLKVIDPSSVKQIEELEAIIKKAEASLKPAIINKMITFKPFPSNETLIKKLYKKRNEVYKQLELDNITCRNKEMVKAIVLFDYLAKTTKYDMTAQEETIQLDKAIKKYNYYESQKTFFDRNHPKLQEKLKNATTKEEKEQIKNKLDILVFKYEKDMQNYVKFHINLNNTIGLRLMYNALISGRGVCNHVTHAYQFLLEGLGIKSYAVEAHNPTTNSGHVYNLSVFKTDKKEVGFLSDLTAGIQLKEEDESIMAFSIIKEKMAQRNEQSGHIEFCIKKLNLLETKNNFILEDIYTKELNAQLLKTVSNDEFPNIEYAEALMHISKLNHPYTNFVFKEEENTK